MHIFALQAYCGDKWLDDVRVTIHASKVKSVVPNARPMAGDIRVDTLLPALSNLHSHSFQRAMAGMTEYRAKGRESFWTWRDLMYRFLERITPEQITAIAAQAFMEMQLAGYASVGEFHYIHNQSSGQRYDDPAELSLRIIEAAQQSGIGLTHLPVLYTYAGVDRAPLTGGQTRFYNDTDSFSEIVTRTKKVAHKYDDMQVGIAPHSLRATCISDIRRTLSDHPNGPVHIHIAEQQKEVRDVQSTLGSRPVEWLLDHIEVNDRWCLIHATHMTHAESRAVAQSGAVAGLCPITEANLGDGFFDGPTFLSEGGRFGIGTDSNVNISMTEELRLLEYSQRLRDQHRNILVDATSVSTGKSLFLGAALGGAQALDRDCGRIVPGALADLIAIDSQSPRLCALKKDQLFDGLVFASNDQTITDLWSAGRHQVKNGRHKSHDRITTRFKSALNTLLADNFGV